MKLSFKIGIGSAVALVFISLFGWTIFPALLKHMIKKSVTLKPGGEIRQMWSKTPFPVDFKVYIFNVTNAKEVHTHGDTPVLDEIGPFFFDEWKEKVNIVDNEADDTVSFNPKTRFVFNKQKSGELTMEEIITIPHPMMTGMLLAVAREKPTMLALVGKALKEIFNDPESIFVTASVREILFDGLVVNCSVTSFGAKAVCANIKAQADGLGKLGEDEYLFSFFGVKNKTIEERFKVKRGLKNSHDVGRMVTYKNATEMKAWSTKACNQYYGTDSTIFPPFLKKEEGLWSYAPDLCRSLGAFFVKDTDYLGLPVREYHASFGDMSTNEGEKCYCLSPKQCLKKGVMDLFKCTGAPIVVSMPHFYDCDPSYQHGVRGIHPEEEKHGIRILFEPMSGSPVSAHKRLQFSLPIQKIPKVGYMTQLPEVLLPILWVEEGLSLGPEVIDQIDKKLFRTIRIVNAIKWIVISLSIIGLIAAVILHFYKRNNISLATVAPAFKLTRGLPHMNGNKDTDVEQKRSSIISTISNNKKFDSQKY